LCRQIFIVFQRHVTRQKILKWQENLKFPPKPRVSRDGINFMQQLLCEPEDRIGSQSTASTTRPDSLIMQARRSGFINSFGGPMSVDGADIIKVYFF
jgi:protein-serine/threonine kinase